MRFTGFGVQSWSETSYFVSGINPVKAIMLILDGNSEHVAHAWRKIGLFGLKNPICDCSRSNVVVVCVVMISLEF